MAPYWFPVVTLMLGAAGGYLADALRDSRAAARDREAAEQARKQARDAFQRETLIELQDWVVALGRATAGLHREMTLNFSDSGRFARSEPSEWEGPMRDGSSNVMRFRVRVLDDEARALAEEFSHQAMFATMGPIDSEDHDTAALRATAAWEHSADLGPRLNDRIGELLRSLP